MNSLFWCIRAKCYVTARFCLTTQIIEETVCVNWECEKSLKWREEYEESKRKEKHKKNEKAVCLFKP